jgi:hypothetical protein
MARKPYPSDVKDGEWEFVAPYLALIREDSPQREHDLRDIHNALRWVARAQLSGGALKSRSGLKEGSRVLVGKHDSKHGIDGIGVGPDGKPVIFEFSMYDKKALGLDTDGLVQLSPEWVADRWSKLVAVATPARLDELRAAGIDPKWLKPVAADDAGSWARKLVVAHDSALTDTNRLAAKLGPGDLMILGGD